MQVSTKALEVIKAVQNAVSKSITGVSFLSIKNYTNKQGAVTNYLINVGVNFDRAKQKDIETLQSLNTNQHDFKSPMHLIEDARHELIAAFKKPDIARSLAQKDAYTIIFDGVKVHNETGKLYIYGYRVNKTVLVEGEYKTVKSSALTIAKNELRKLLKTGKFTQFAVEVGNTLTAKGETIEL